MKEIARKSYNKIARWYHEVRTKGQGWFYNEMLEMPTTLKFLRDVRGKKILDLGCGTGIYAKILRRRGARIRGIDISEEMIKIARKENPKIEFKVGSMDNLPYKNKEFDIVLAALSIEYLKEWDKVFKEVRRVLKSRGLFIFSGSNPVIGSIKKIMYKGKKLRVIKDYFKESKKEDKWFFSKVGKYATIIYYHKTYGTIVKIIVRNGFEIIDYKDAYPLKKAEKLFPADFKLWSNMPYFCTWKARKK